MERRFLNTDLANCEIRENEDGGKMIVGYAAVFYREGVEGTEFKLGDDWVERIAPTAFDNALERGDDVRGLFNHDSNNLLARTKSKTARLFVDKIGLRFEMDLAKDSNLANDVAVSLKRKDLDGSSFAFNVSDAGEEYQDLPDGRVLRLITSVSKLWDVGPVTYPAYEGASSGLRSEDRSDAEAGFKAHEVRKAKEQEDTDEVSKAKLKREKQLRNLESY